MQRQRWLRFVHQMCIICQWVLIKCPECSYLGGWGGYTWWWLDWWNAPWALVWCWVLVSVGLQRETKATSGHPIRARCFCFGGWRLDQSCEGAAVWWRKQLCPQFRSWTEKWEVGSKRRRAASRCRLTCSHAAFGGLDPVTFQCGLVLHY